jgi:hypothetical protein
MWLLVGTRSVLTRKQQDWKWLNTQTSLGCSLLSKCHTASRCAYTCNFIYVHRKVRPFAVPICINLTYDQQHYPHIAYTQFHHKVDSNMERTDWKLFVPPKWTTIFISLILKSLCAFSVPNFIQIWRKKKQTKLAAFHWWFHVKYDFHCRFSRRAHWLNGITWRPLVPNFNHIGQEIWNVQVQRLL